MTSRPLDAAEVDAVLAVGRERGLDAVGIAPAQTLTRARSALYERRAAGLSAGMAFTYRNPDRSTDPAMAVRDARSIVVGARSYLLAEPPRPEEPCGRVARYAWVDHYEQLRVALRAMAHELRARGWKAVAFADDNSVVDREVAWLAGIGWFGKNANLLLPRAGSWFVLGCVITDAPLPTSAEPVADGCGGCRRCLDACPTGAIVAPGVIDANRCLAWLVQRPGVFPREHRAALADRLYGCDDCQDVCPPNLRYAAAPAASTIGGTGVEVEAWVPVLDLLDATDDALLERYGRWYIAQREPRWLRRNGLLVLANTADGRHPRVDAVLRRYLADADPVLRAHAVWAAARLGRHDLLPARDDDPLVAAELADVADVGGLTSLAVRTEPFLPSPR